MNVHRGWCSAGAALVAALLVAAPVAAGEVSEDARTKDVAPAAPSSAEAASAPGETAPAAAPEPSDPSTQRDPATVARPAATGGKGKATEGTDHLDFDLLGTPTAAPVVDEGRLRLRRSMLTAHQAMGLALLTSTLSLAVVGQLSYTDRFGGGPSTGQYELPHAALAYTTLGLFASTGLMAMLAPVPIAKSNQGFDRVTLHKLGLLTATAGMVTQGVLGIVTSRREGYLNQRDVARAHQVVGYATTAAMAVGVGALVF